MSDPPPKPKPGSLRDRIAAFEQKPAASPAPPPPRPKPGNLSKWTPRAPSPTESPPEIHHAEGGMSASDAKESITKGGSLKERMAALQGLGAFGGGPAASPPPKPLEKPKWKPPPQVAVSPPVIGDDDEEPTVSSGILGDKPAVSPLKPPSDDIIAAISKSPSLARDELPDTEGEAPAEEGEKETVDPEEEERQRRAAIASRMARLGGTRVGMAPIFGRKPEVKPKPASLAAKPAEGVLPAEAPAAEPVLTERDVEHAQAETEAAANVPLPTSPPVNEGAAIISPPLPGASPEYFSAQPSPSASPNAPPRAMPVPQGPRRAAPPRKKASSKATPPAETVLTSPGLGAEEPAHTSPDVSAEPQVAPQAVGDIAEVGVTSANPDTSQSRPNDQEHAEEVPNSIVLSASAGNDEPVIAPPPRPVSASSDPRPESPDEPEVDLKSQQGLTIEHETEAAAAEPSQEPPHVQVAPDEDAALEVEEDEASEEIEATRQQRIAELGGQSAVSSPAEATAPSVERKASPEVFPHGTYESVQESQPAARSSPSVQYSVSQQGGSRNAENEEDDEDDESHHPAQALSQHVFEEQRYETSESGAIDPDDEDTRVIHEDDVGLPVEAAQPEQDLEANYDDAEEGAYGGGTSSQPSIPHEPNATIESEAALLYTEPLVLASATPPDDDEDEDDMAPPRITRPLPPAPVPPPETNASTRPIHAPAVSPPPPSSKRTSLPPPTRAAPVPASESEPPIHAPSPQRTPSTKKRTSVPPPSRAIPAPAPETSNVASPPKRASIPPPSRAAPVPSASHAESFVRPPSPPALSYLEQAEPISQEPEALEGIPQGQAEAVPPVAPVPVRKPSLPPPVPDGRKSMESRRSTESRRSHEERRGSGQYGVPATPAFPPPTPPPSTKRAPPSLVLEQEFLDEDIGDPIDPRFHTPAKSPIPAVPRAPPPTAAEPLSSVPPASAAALQPVDESGEDEDQKRRQTIAERMAKLGGIKFGAPPPLRRTQPPPAAPAESAETGENDSGSAQVPAERAEGTPEQGEDEEDEQARRQRIATRIAGMGGMRVGMLPTQHGTGIASPPPPPPAAPARREEGATPRSLPRAIPPPRPPVARPSESDQEYEHPSSSEDGVQVEAEESELEEVQHEDLEDDHGVETVEEEEEAPRLPPPRSARPPVPTSRPPVPSPVRRPSADVTPTPPPRTASFDTVTSIPRPSAHQAVSDYVLVEEEEAQPAPPPRSSRMPPPPRSAPPPPESSDPASTGQWELPSIPSGSLDFGDSGATSDLSASMWSEDSTIYPPAAPPSAMSAQPSISSKPPPPAGVPRGPAPVPEAISKEKLLTLHASVGIYVADAAAALHERSKREAPESSSHEGFVSRALSMVHNASPPQGPGEYGFLIYARTAAQVTTDVGEIMPGDIAVIENAKLKGHKGLHTYSMNVGEGVPCVGIVSEFDSKKSKFKTLQAGQRGGQAIVESVSYRLEDLKSGTIKVYRVLEA